MNTFEDFTGDEDKGFNTVLSEHPEVRILWEKRAGLSGPVEINGVNPILHVMLEGSVENQINDPELPEVREAVERLERTGLSRHAARAVIAQVFTSFFFEVIKNRKRFDREKYVVRLSMLGRDFSAMGRNRPCPCGSGMKFKRCCADAVKDYQVSPMAGRLVLGQGSYFTGPNVPGMEGPLDPLYQLENRVHIARFLVREHNVEGAVQALQENVTFAEDLGCDSWLRNALYDLLDLCLHNRSLADEGLGVIERLLQLAGDENKGNLLCDKANLMARKGQVEEADRFFENILETMPGWHYGRYRFALYLEETGRKEQAVQVLQDLVAAKEQIDAETYRDAYRELTNLKK